jgi:hypothetical protein
MHHMTTDLRQLNARTEEAEGPRDLIPRLRLQAGEVDAAAVNPRTGSRLEATTPKSKRSQMIRKLIRRGLPGPSPLDSPISDKKAAIKERSGCDDHRITRKNGAILELNPLGTLRTL